MSKKWILDFDPWDYFRQKTFSHSWDDDCLLQDNLRKSSTVQVVQAADKMPIFCLLILKNIVVDEKKF